MGEIISAMLDWITRHPIITALIVVTIAAGIYRHQAIKAKDTVKEAKAVIVSQNKTIESVEKSHERKREIDRIPDAAVMQRLYQHWCRDCQ